MSSVIYGRALQTDVSMVKCFDGIVLVSVVYTIVGSLVLCNAFGLDSG